MENSLTTSLLVTLVGMGAVFLAMALIYASMRLLTAVVRDKQAVEPSPGTELGPAPPIDSSRGERRMLGLRATAIAVALARAEEAQQPKTGTDEPYAESTPWGEYYRFRQLRPSGRGRGA